MRIKLIALVVLFVLISSTAQAAIDMRIIKQIESGGDPNAVSHCGAIGLYQIMPSAALKEFNDFNSADFTKDDLFNPNINYIVANWYMNKRIPQMLRHYGREVSIRNQIIAYNAGIYYVKNDHLPLPNETINYLRKYEALGRVFR